ncbi:MAG: alginate lyase family protein [Candidatus Accumulibacter sp.]|uniref:alginate lyase family protein n=1 Tax=Accumulibacter sp. TaxID=2053492 RepID=UPI001AC36593|nr:alginate lyase family protein [Accumulibacter sp.]MBN8438785.1 alginate lyase family protein [Accumulibacter sp.]
MLTAYATALSALLGSHHLLISIALSHSSFSHVMDKMSPNTIPAKDCLYQPLLASIIKIVGCIRTCVAYLCILIVPCTGSASSEVVLKSPVNVKMQMLEFGGRESSGVCKQLPTLPHKVSSVAFYTDTKASVIDPVLYQRFLELRKTVSDEEDYLATQNTRYIQANAAARVGIAKCLQSHLIKFAEDDAFTGSEDIRGGGAVRLMSITPLLTYLLVRNGNGIDPDVDEKIRAWIARLMELLLSLEKNYKYDNNIEDWTAAAFALGAVALNRRGLLDHAVTIAEKKSGMVDADGFLPLELARGRMSVEYNLSALQALSIIIAVEEANGRDFLSEPVGVGLVRMMRRMVLTIKEPASFLQFTDTSEAIAKEHFDRQSMGWLEIYYRKTGDIDALKAICEHKPLFSWRTGGDWFVLFGSPNQCSVGH